MRQLKDGEGREIRGHGRSYWEKEETQVQLIKTQVSGTGRLLIKVERRHVPFRAGKEGNERPLISFPM